eukprot:TRINITY_DN29188_c0_g1_i1.p1 TRINITY_DN29188_c0_g1~~TRINITY_DN29188_c0_g1_i1.p1  ORF type:complete len:273 (-),score=58.49 TRINITY_DN29188_c0_g1_i1:147-965(-)
MSAARVQLRCKRLRTEPHFVRQRCLKLLAMMAALTTAMMHDMPARCFSSLAGGSGALLGRALHGGRESAVVRGSFFDDMKSNMISSATKAATGLSDEESNALLDRGQEGKLDFNDYQKILKMFQNMGSAADPGGAMSAMGKMFNGGQDDATVQEAKDKMKEVDEILAAMGPEDRADPSKYTKGGETTRKAVLSLAKKSGKSKQDIEEIIIQFQTLRSMLQKLGPGADFDEVADQVSMEQKEFMAATKNRAARRSAKAKNKGKDKALPEWMTL